MLKFPALGCEAPFSVGEQVAGLDHLHVWQQRIHGQVVVFANDEENFGHVLRRVPGQSLRAGRDQHEVPTEVRRRPVQGRVHQLAYRRAY